MKKNLYWLKKYGENCPICGAKISGFENGDFCTNNSCPGSVVDGKASLTTAEAENFKEVISNPLKYCRNLV